MSKSPNRSDFAHRNYRIPRDRQHHALALQLGLGMMQDGFACELCYWCKGEGVNRDSRWESCGVCLGLGLLQGEILVPAFTSQRHQVLTAAANSGLLDDVEII